MRSASLGILLIIFALTLTLGRTPHAAPPAGPGTPAFEAKGDGTTDDTAAIQKLVDGGGSIAFPRGVYRITKTITIDLDRVGFTCLSGGNVARVVMAGEGPAFKFIGTHAGSADPGTMKPNVWEKQRMPVVEGLEIVGDNPAADGIEASGTMQLTLSRVLVRRCRHGIRLAERNRNVLIADCHLYENRGVGLFLDNVNLHQINVTGSHISYNAEGGIVVRAGQVRNLHITGCDIEANFGEGKPPTANVFVDSTGGSNAEVAITGCTIQHSRKFPGSTNIWVRGDAAKAKGAEEYREGHITITGNVLSDTNYNIRLEHARGVVITGNTLWTGRTLNMLVEHSSNIVIGANNLDRNPRYFREEDDATDAVVFTDCRDCTITGLSLKGTRHTAAGLSLTRCDRFNITGLALLDCEGAGLAFQDLTNSRISDCLIRDDRKEAKRGVSIRGQGGSNTMIVDNALGLPSEILDGTGHVERNYMPKP